MNIIAYVIGILFSFLNYIVSTFCYFFVYFCLHIPTANTNSSSLHLAYRYLSYIFLKSYIFKLLLHHIGNNFLNLCFIFIKLKKRLFSSEQKQKKTAEKYQSSILFLYVSINMTRALLSPSKKKLYPTC